MGSISKQRMEAAKMLKFLQREEAYYLKVLESMKQELMRLQIEELALKAFVRQGQLEVDQERDVNGSSVNGCENVNDLSSISDSVASLSKVSKKIQFDEGTSSSSCSLVVDESSQKSMSQPSPAANDSVMSNITDERYLEPLVLNPQYHDADFIEFDD